MFLTFCKAVPLLLWSTKQRLLFSSALNLPFFIYCWKALYLCKFNFQSPTFKESSIYPVFPYNSISWHRGSVLWIFSVQTSGFDVSLVSCWSKLESSAGIHQYFNLSDCTPHFSQWHINDINLQNSCIQTAAQPHYNKQILYILLCTVKLLSRIAGNICIY